MWCVDLPAQVDALETKAKAAQELLAQYKPAEVPVQPPIEQEQFHEEDGDDHLLEEEEEADEDEDEDEDGEENEDGDNGGNLREETEETKKEPRILLERTDDVKEALEQAEQDVAGTPPLPLPHLLLCAVRAHAPERTVHHSCCCCKFRRVQGLQEAQRRGGRGGDSCERVALPRFLWLLLAPLRRGYDVR
jgi:hypothetical protein